MIDDDRFQRGAALFDSGEYFLAHEVWEELWLAEEGPEKIFLQGLIQAAAAFHHYVRGNFSGAQSLLASAANKLEGFQPDHRGILVEGLLEEIVRWARLLGDGKDPGWDALPRIKPA